MMYGLFVTVCIMLMVVIGSMMGIIMAWEMTPCDKVPQWLDNAYEKLYEIFDKVLTRQSTPAIIKES